MKHAGSPSETGAYTPVVACEEALASAAERLRSRVRVAVRQAAMLRTPVLAWTVVGIPPVDPVDLFSRALAVSADPMYWDRPADDCSLVGVGCAWTFTTTGPGRFDEARVAWQRVLAGAIGDSPAPVFERPEERGRAGRNVPSAGPVLMGGFSFAPGGPALPIWSGFEAASLVIPRVLLSIRGGEACATLSLLVHPTGPDPGDAERAVEESVGLLSRLLDRAATPGGAIDHRIVALEEHPPVVEWKTLVARAAEAVRRRDLTKVVMARSLRVTGNGFDPPRVLRRLRADYPTCAVFAVARGDRCFLGATPERLVRVRGGDVNVMALAGSAPRGGTAEEDRRLGESLLASTKDCVEHAVVVDMLRDALDGLCSSVMVSGPPSLLKVANVQHLCTPIAARLRDRTTILDLVGRLHPTPAVGGVPREAALAWIRDHEGLDRGWYAGPVGWLDHRGDGDFAVAIRSALLAGCEALLYAGCGIVADSDPEAEYEESRLKLRPLLAALGAGSEV
jgi:isochorismate synthase